MKKFLSTIILRHRRENLKKCSLKGLESRDDLLFISYPGPVFPDLSSYFLLNLEGPPLSREDQKKGIMLLDGTWRYADRMERHTPALHHLPRRSLPSSMRTAYPRRQEDCLNPGRGLASIEALYTAYRILGREIEGLLDNYYWKEEFLQNDFPIFTKGDRDLIVQWKREV